MFIILSTATADATAPVIMKPLPETVLRDARARVTRTATLDGGCVITNNGLAAADRTPEIRARIMTKAACDVLWNLFANHTLFTLSTEEGFFVGAIDRLKVDNGDVKLKFLVKE